MRVRSLCREGRLKREKVRVGYFERIALKHVYYLGWNRSPAQAGCMRQVLGASALGRPRGIGWGGRWEGGSGWGTHINPWLIHVNVWQKPLQYCKVIILQLIKINGGKKKEGNSNPLQCFCLETPHGQRSLAGYSTWSHKESDMTEGLSIAHNISLTQLVPILWMRRRKMKENPGPTHGGRIGLESPQ